MAANAMTALSFVLLFFGAEAARIQMQKRMEQQNKDKVAIECSKAVPGSVAREGWFSSGCKCSEGQEITGDDDACKGRYRKFEPADLAGKGCVCQVLKGAPVSKTPDLDWPGCGQHSGLNALWCENTEGCAIQKLWLDTPRQKCRYSDDFKLRPKEVPRFLHVELKRLEEKSATFAAGGCLFGGWWAKCYRRMSQIIRLLRYVRKAVEQAKADPNHPAHDVASSEATQAALERVAENIAAGFKKHEEGKDHSANFDASYEKLKNNPELVKLAEKEADSKDVTLSEEEKESMQKAASVEAMLAMTGTQLTATQREELRATIEAEGNMGIESEDDVEKAVDEVLGSIDETMNKADTDDMNHVETHEGEHLDDEDDPEDFIARKEEGSSLAEVLGEQAVASRGTGPLKWIFQNGLGWVITRLAWLVLFLVGSAVGLITGPARVIFFPLLFIGCTLSKFIIWVFKDFGYNFLWEGETELMTGGFMKIGQCAPQMWSLIGFDPNANNTGAMAGGGLIGGAVGAGGAAAGAATGAATGALAGPAGIAVGAGVGAAIGVAIGGGIFIDAAQFASDMTGVHHFYKSTESLCAEVKCGENAACHAGKCRCNPGAYPGEGANCGPITTKNGCQCLARWRESQMLGLWSTAHYGCSPGRVCHVDTGDASFATCKDKLKTDTGLFTSFVGEGPPKDSCQPKPFQANVPSL